MNSRMNIYIYIFVIEKIVANYSDWNALFFLLLLQYRKVTVKDST